MAHPRTYRDKDPHLADVRRICLALPETAEVEAWGRPTFRVGTTKKMFIVFTGQDGVYRLVFKPAADERTALVDDQRITIPKYYGPSGWLALDLDGDTDWTEVEELVETSYRQVATKRLVRQLDDVRA